jgi:hypothetical protein
MGDVATPARDLEELLAHCADLGLHVEWRDLGETRRGEFHPHADLIVLSSRLTRRQAVACLAHELGHARFGHRSSTPANERRAWQYAAAILITPAEYAAAEARVGPDVAALALELEVTPRLIEEWRRWWRHRGERSVTVA